MINQANERSKSQIGILTTFVRERISAPKRAGFRMVMRYAKLGFLGFVAVTCFGPSASADQPRQLTTQELEIVRLLDHAARQDPTLKSLSELPWSSNATIIRPEVLGLMGACLPAQGAKDRGLFIVSWSQVALDGSCGKYGYYAILKLKAGRISRLTLGESEIVVTPGNEARD